MGEMAYASLALLGAWIAKLIWWRMGKDSGSTRETATGLGALGTVRPLMPPHTSENYLQKEMGFQIGRKHADTIRIIALIIGAAAPLAILSYLPVTAITMTLAFGLAMAGLFFERWLFFAEAKHVVMFCTDSSPIGNHFLVNTTEGIHNPHPPLLL